MKKLILFAFVILSLTAVQSKTMTEYGGDGYFYTALAPYGEWIELNDGMTVWRPIMMAKELGSIYNRTLGVDSRRLVLGFR